MSVIHNALLARERELRQRAKSLALAIRISGMPIEIPEDIRAWFLNSDEFSRFERYLVHFGLFKRSDDKWYLKRD